MRVVLDANVLASGSTPRQGVPGRLIELGSLGAYELFLSAHILESTARAWNKPYYRRIVTDAQRTQFMTHLRRYAVMVVPTDTVHGVAEDEEDDLVLATAVAAHADCLITGDKHLREIGSYGGVTILTPREFLDVLIAETLSDDI